MQNHLDSDEEVEKNDKEEDDEEDEEEERELIIRRKKKKHVEKKESVFSNLGYETYFFVSMDISKVDFIVIFAFT